MADSSNARLERTIIALEARLASFGDDGVKTIPATSNPGEEGRECGGGVDTPFREMAMAAVARSVRTPL